MNIDPTAIPLTDTISAPPEVRSQSPANPLHGAVATPGNASAQDLAPVDSKESIQSDQQKRTILIDAQLLTSIPARDPAEKLATPSGSNIPTYVIDYAPTTSSLRPNMTANAAFLAMIEEDVIDPYVTITTPNLLDTSQQTDFQFKPGFNQFVKNKEMMFFRSMLETLKACAADIATPGISYQQVIEKIKNTLPDIYEKLRHEKKMTFQHISSNDIHAIKSLDPDIEDFIEYHLIKEKLVNVYGSNAVEYYARHRLELDGKLGKAKKIEAERIFSDTYDFTSTHIPDDIEKHTYLEIEYRSAYGDLKKEALLSKLPSDNADRNHPSVDALKVAFAVLLPASDEEPQGKVIYALKSTVERDLTHSDDDGITSESNAVLRRDWEAAARASVQKRENALKALDNAFKDQIIEQALRYGKLERIRAGEQLCWARFTVCKHNISYIAELLFERHGEIHVVNLSEKCDSPAIDEERWTQAIFTVDKKLQSNGELNPGNALPVAITKSRMWIYRESTSLSTQEREEIVVRRLEEIVQPRNWVRNSIKRRGFGIYEHQDKRVIAKIAERDGRYEIVEADLPDEAEVKMTFDRAKNSPSLMKEFTIETIFGMTPGLQDAYRKLAPQGWLVGAKDLNLERSRYEKSRTFYEHADDIIVVPEHTTILLSPSALQEAGKNNFSRALLGFSLLNMVTANTHTPCDTSSKENYLSAQIERAGAGLLAEFQLEVEPFGLDRIFQTQHFAKYSSELRHMGFRIAEEGCTDPALKEQAIWSLGCAYASHAASSSIVPDYLYNVHIWDVKYERFYGNDTRRILSSEVKALQTIALGQSAKARISKLELSGEFWRLPENAGSIGRQAIAVADYVLKDITVRKGFPQCALELILHDSFIYAEKLHALSKKTGENKGGITITEKSPNSFSGKNQYFHNKKNISVAYTFDASGWISALEITGLEHLSDQLPRPGYKFDPDNYPFPESLLGLGKEKTAELIHATVKPDNFFCFGICNDETVIFKNDKIALAVEFTRSPEALEITAIKPLEEEKYLILSPTVYASMHALRSTGWTIMTTSLKDEVAKFQFQEPAPVDFKQMLLQIYIGGAPDNPNRILELEIADALGRAQFPPKDLSERLISRGAGIRMQYRFLNDLRLFLATEEASQAMGTGGNPSEFVKGVKDLKQRIEAHFQDKFKGEFHLTFKEPHNADDSELKNLGLLDRFGRLDDF